MRYVDVPDLKTVLWQGAIWLVSLAVVAAYSATVGGGDTITLLVLSGGGLALAAFAIKLSGSLSDAESNIKAMVPQPVRVSSLGDRRSRAA